MKRRVIGWIASAIRGSHAEPQPHFHKGPHAVPAVCYDAHCGTPRLDPERD